MINFRYHVVSLTAVFLALAIGLVVGTAALNGPAADNLQNQINALNKDNSNKRDQIDQYREELNRSQDFATQLAPTVLGGKLAGRRIVVLALPNTDQYVDGVIAMLKVAGATVTGKITVNDKFFDPALAFELTDLAGQSSTPSISKVLPLNSDGVETASAQLALTLLQHAAGTTQATPADVTSVLTAYTKGGYIATDDKATTDGKTVGGAEGTVIVSGSPPVDKGAAKKTAAAVTLATQFSKDRPLVVSGDGVGDGNLIASVRGDATLVKEISTVDNASTVDGQVATAMTVAERVVQNKVGQYGLAAGSTSLVPKAVP